MVFLKGQNKQSIFGGKSLQIRPKRSFLEEKKQTVQYQYHWANKKVHITQQESPKSRYVCTDMYESKAYLYVTFWTPTSHQTNQNNHPSLSGRVDIKCGKNCTSWCCPRPETGDPPKKFLNNIQKSCLVWAPKNQRVFSVRNALKSWNTPVFFSILFTHRCDPNFTLPSCKKNKPLH